jgi:N-acetylneuraminic acid mutarotase
LTDSWTQRAFNPAPINGWSSAFAIDDKGYLLTDGGFFEYKSSTEQWIPRANFPGETDGGRAAFSINGKGYIICGYIGFLNPTSKQVWEFRPETNEWVLKEEFPGSSRRFASTFSINNKGYIGTGTNGTNMNDFWEYDENLSSINEELELSVSIYPNPSQKEINFELNKEGTEQNITLSIFNLNGQQVFSSGITHHKTITKEEIGTGTFIYTISKANRTHKKGKLIFY